LDPSFARRKQARWQPAAVQEGEQLEGLKLVSIEGSKLVANRFRSDVWHSELGATGPIRPSLPWCFSSAAPPLDPSCAGRKQARWQPAVQEGEQIEGLELDLD